MQQHGLFDEIEHDARIESHRESWRLCWGWEGPKVGGLCDIHSCVVETEDGERIYAYTEQCRLLELRPDGRWLAEIAMGETWGTPWPKDGTRVVLAITDIWPPVRQLKAD